jgi:hypothetical protein
MELHYHLSFGSTMMYTCAGSINIPWCDCVYVDGMYYIVLVVISSSERPSKAFLRSVVIWDSGKVDQDGTLFYLSFASTMTNTCAGRINIPLMRWCICSWNVLYCIDVHFFMWASIERILRSIVFRFWKSAGPEWNSTTIFVSARQWWMRALVVSIYLDAMVYV